MINQELRENLQESRKITYNGGEIMDKQELEELLGKKNFEKSLNMLDITVIAAVTKLPKKQFQEALEEWTERSAKINQYKDEIFSEISDFCIKHLEGKI